MVENHRDLRYLPNKKFILGFLILLVIGGGFFIFRNLNKEENQLPKSSEKGPVVAEEIGKDSDNDGLKDWEETLRKIRPQESVSGDESVPAIKPPSTLTEALGQEFFGEYMRLKQGSNGELSEYDKTELVNYLMSVLNDFQNKTGDYLKSDVKIAEKENESSIKEYGNNLALVIKKYFDPLPETEMTVLKKAASEENQTELKKLIPIADAYRNAAKDAFSLKTPPSFAESHLNLINYFNNIAQEINAMQKAFEDPVQTLLALEKYQADSSAAYGILRSLNDYFLNKKVVFENNEPAEFFKVYLE